MPLVTIRLVSFLDFLAMEGRRPWSKEEIIGLFFHIGRRLFRGPRTRGEPADGPDYAAHAELRPGADGGNYVENVEVYRDSGLTALESRRFCRMTIESASSTATYAENYIADGHGRCDVSGRR
jgi:hypothetical protein